MSSTASILSLENPTRDFLHANYKKEELQKQCRELGFTKVWVTKNELIDMILEKHRSSRVVVSESNAQGEQLTQRSILDELEELRERVYTRDNEIEDLKELLKSAHVTINKLSDRVSSVEDQVNLLHGASINQQVGPSLQGSESSNSQPVGTLLLGDTNLSAVRASDLSSCCSIRTIKGANIDLVKCWISEKLQWVPSNCILYCGLQDILDKSATSDIFDGLGSMVTELKQANENMNIYICELAPIPNVQDFDEHINNFNNQLVAWSSNNGVSVIKTNLEYRLGTGEVDHMCFTETNEEHRNFLNRFGIIRLLNVISKQCPSLKLHENWENIMSQNMPASSYYRGQKNNFHENNSKQTDYDIRRYTEKQRFNPRGRQNQGPNDRRFSSQTFSRHYENSSVGPLYGRRDVNRRSYFENDHQNNRLDSQNFSHHHRRPLARANQRGGEPENRFRPRSCSNCGETNHTLSECRFSHRVKCNQCNVYGHKTRLCPYNA